MLVFYSTMYIERNSLINYDLMLRFFGFISIVRILDFDANEKYGLNYNFLSVEIASYLVSTEFMMAKMFHLSENDVVHLNGNSKL